MAPLDTALEHTRRSLNLGCIFSIRLVCLGPFLWKLFLLCHSGLQLICMLLFLSMLWHRPLPSTQYSFLFVLGVDLHWSVSGLYSSARSVLLSSPSDFFLKLHLFYFKTTFGSFSQCVFLLRYSWSLISTQSSLSSLTIFIVRYKSSESRIPKTVSPGCHFLICIFPTFVVEKWAKKTKQSAHCGDHISACWPSGLVAALCSCLFRAGSSALGFLLGYFSDWLIAGHKHPYWVSYPHPGSL